MASRIMLHAHLEDDLGNAIASTPVTVYASDGTTLVADTMKSAFTGGTTVSNPVTTDSHGNILVFFDAAGTDVPGDVVLSGTANGSTVTQRVYLYPHPDDISAATGRSYADIRDYSGTAGGDVTTAIGSANTALVNTGGVIFIPQASSASSINSTVTLSRGVWLWGTGWNEGTGTSQSNLAAGAAMTTMFTISNPGCGFAFINLTDPAPLCTVDIVNVVSGGTSCKFIETSIRATLASLPLVNVGSGAGRGRVTGGRWVNADNTSTDGTCLTFSSSSSDWFVGGGVTFQGPIGIKQAGGSNIQYHSIHITGNGTGGGTKSTSNMTVTGGNCVLTNVQFDTCPAGPHLNVIPAASTAAFVNMNGGRFLQPTNNPDTDNTYPCFLVDSSAASSMAVLTVSDCSGYADFSTPLRYAYVCRRIGANSFLSVIGGQYVACLADWDTANLAPQVFIGVGRMTGNPPTTFKVSTDIIGSVNGVQTADVVVNNSATVTTLTGMQFSIGVSETWRFRFVVFYESATGGPGPDAQFAISGPAAATRIRYGIVNDFTTDFTRVNRGQTAINQPVAAIGAGTSLVSMAIIEGIFRNGANAGTVVLKGAQNTAVTSNTTFMQDSYFDAWRLP